MKNIIAFIILLPSLVFATDYECQGNKNSIIVEGSTATFYSLEHLAVSRRGEIIIPHEVGQPEEVIREVQEFREVMSSPHFTIIVKGNQAIVTQNVLDFLKDRTYFCSEYHHPIQRHPDPQAGRNTCTSRSCH